MESAVPTSEDEQVQLHIFFFPFLASGHIIPLADVAHLFARRGVRVSFVTTDGNVERVGHVVDEALRNGHTMQTLVLPFPCEDVGLPKGCETTDVLPMTDSALEKFYNLVQKLEEPLGDLIREHRPDCLVSDELYPWTSDLAVSLGVPRVAFDGTSHFTVCALDEIEFHNPHLAVSADTEPFLIPKIPHKIQVTKADLPKFFHYPRFVLDQFREAKRKSYGLLMNSFDELAPEYVELLRKDAQRRTWNVGPIAALADRGKDDNIQIKSWLDSKDQESVLYIAFGTECTFTNDQLRAIAFGLEYSGHSFIWVVRGGGGGLDTIEEWLPEDFEKRLEGKGLMLRGWAPQRLILNHQATGGFMTHCGWNSSSEALSAGVPLITWPLHSEQFINERLLVDVLGTGISALEGVRRSIYKEQKEMVKTGTVKRVVERLMEGGGEAIEIRKRANKYKELSRSVLEEKGSSYINLTCLINELKTIAMENRKSKCQS